MGRPRASRCALKIRRARPRYWPRRHRSGRHRRGGRSAGLYRGARGRAHEDSVQLARFGGGQPQQISRARAISCRRFAGPRFIGYRYRRGWGRRAGPRGAAGSLSLRAQAALALRQPRRDPRRTSRGIRRCVSPHRKPCSPIPISRACTTSRTASCKWKTLSKAASSRSKVSSPTGELRVLALFDKPDPLDGPFFEETIYVTPSREVRRHARCDRANHRTRP